MTDILELTRKAGFIKQDMSLAHEAIEKNVYLVPSDSHLREFASLLREKFIAELGEPVGYVLSDANYYAVGYDQRIGRVLWTTSLNEFKQGAAIYALPKDKDELK
jgi:hypothetical protein